MKKKTILPLILILAFSACENGSDTKKETLNKLNVFVLCEGNFGQSNASLWSLDPELDGVQGPIYKNITGNSLGDIGQSMALRDNRLWVINNNTHTIEIFLLDEEILHENSISLPGSSPRYMTFVNDKAYITAPSGDFVAINTVGVAVYLAFTKETHDGTEILDAFVSGIDQSPAAKFRG